MDEERFLMERPDLANEPGLEPRPRDLRWSSLVVMLVASLIGVGFYLRGAPAWVAFIGAFVTLAITVLEMSRTRRQWARVDRSNVIDRLERP